MKNLSSKIYLLASMLAATQVTVASTDWVGTADYSQAPSATGSEPTVGPFNTYDFGIGASLIQNTITSPVDANGDLSGTFTGYYQTMVTDHVLAGTGVTAPGLSTSGSGTGFELTLTSSFSGTFSSNTNTQLTNFTVNSGSAALYFDTLPDFSFANDSGFNNGDAILTGTITSGNGFTSGSFGLGVTQMDINFSGTFGNYDQNVYDPDTISGGSTLFSINLNNQSANSVTNAITTGNNTVMGSAYNPASSILAEADGTLSLTAVPLPASVWFLVSGLISLFSFKKRQ